jgi:hypothetical protein
MRRVARNCSRLAATCYGIIAVKISLRARAKLFFTTAVIVRCVDKS